MSRKPSLKTGKIAQGRLSEEPSVSRGPGVGVLGRQEEEVAGTWLSGLGSRRKSDCGGSSGVNVTRRGGRGGWPSFQLPGGRARHCQGREGTVKGP